MATFLGNNQGALELPGIGGVNAEIGRQFHRAAHPFGNENKGTVGKHGGIQCGEKIVASGHDAT